MKLFEIKENQIIFYPKRQDFLSLGIILFVSLYMIIIPISLTTYEKDPNIDIISICLAFLIPPIIVTICFLFGKTQIIIDTNKKTVTKKNLFQSKKIALLENVSHIQFSDNGSQYVTTYTYELIFKNDIYGEGIKLTSRLRKKSKKLTEIYDNAIVKIENILAENAPTKKNIATEQKIHLFHEEHRGCYVYKERSLVALFFAILTLAVFIYLILFQQLDTYYHYILLALSLLLFMGYGSQTKIDTSNQTIESSMYDFFKSKCHFSEIAQIITEKSFNNGSYSTTNIIARTNRDKKPYRIHLTSIKDTKKVALFINDLSILLAPVKERLLN